MNKILSCTVAYNENRKLRRVIERFLASEMAGRADFLVVDDFSTDETPRIVDEFLNRHIHSVRHPARRGVGAAIRSAMHHARDNGYDILTIMAGNDKDDPGEIPLLVAPILHEGFDLAQGSRYLNGSRAGGAMPRYRKAATRLHPRLFRFMTGYRLTDTTNGFRAIRLSMLSDPHIDIEQPWLDKYELEPYLLYKAVTLGYKVKEVPVTKKYPPKNEGYTKMKPLIGWWSILRPLFYLKLGIKK